MSFKEKAVLFLATGCFIGNIPFAPGTFGTLLGLPFCFVLSKINLRFAVPCTLLFIILAIGLAQIAEKILKKKDSGRIVIDEIAGLMVTLIGIPFNLESIVSGFLVFRALDIFKPFPIRRLERNLSGGTGVVLDDVLAGVYSNIIVRLVLYFIHIT
jgi:phosphatidylglycerophosphatase A